jgi:quercetin dioxygenase-like cupin family protein
MSGDDINTDLSVVARVDTAAQDWQDSPSNSVWRKPLFRSGGEFGPVTSVVRYAAGGRFRTHMHPEGEEILVLSGVFSDEHGDYPQGSYLLNPDGSQHAPFSDPGCTLFVRLRQYPGADRPQLCIPSGAMEWQASGVDGVSVKSLYRQDGYPQAMSLIRLHAGAVLPAAVVAGPSEVFVLQGELLGLGASGLVSGGWVRLPAGHSAQLHSAEGCEFYLRRDAEPERMDHLNEPD